MCSDSACKVSLNVHDWYVSCVLHVWPLTAMRSVTVSVSHKTMSQYVAYRPHVVQSACSHLVQCHVLERIQPRTTTTVRVYVG